MYDKELQEKRFSTHVQISADNGCWVWRGALRNQNPLFYDGEKQVYARRWAYEFYISPIPPKGRLHCNRVRCEMGSRYCVNPKHYDLLWQESNVMPMRQHVESGTVVPRKVSAEELEAAKQRFIELELANPILG